MAFTRRGPCCFETAAGYFEGKVNLLHLFSVLWVCLLCHVRNGGRFPLEEKILGRGCTERSIMLSQVFACPLVSRTHSKADVP